jgi:magnesium-transporting ATPase (P-type)
LKDGKIHRKKWKDIRMGDILEIKKDEQFPADMALLYAEGNDNSPVDLVFVDTMNLDGETNLKPRTIFDSSISTTEKLHGINASLTYESPNKNLDKWDGTLKNNSQKEVYGNIENLLLRGCTLRNVRHAYGVVIYVGPKSKIVMNSTSVPDKLSNMMRTMN